MGWPTSYEGWIARLKEWLTVVDLPDTVFGYCLDSANQRLNRDLNSQWMEASFPYTIVDANPIDIIAEVADFNRMRLVTPRGALPLKVKAINEFKVAVAENPSGSGDPEIYTVNAMKLFIWSPPVAGTIIDIDYYVDVPPLSDAVNSNIFTIKHPDAYLYASLLEATPFIAEDERLETWTTFYNNIREAINVTADRANKGSTPLQRQLKVM
jgi:hypothetical protein